MLADANIPSAGRQVTKEPPVCFWPEVSVAPVCQKGLFSRQEATEQC